MFGITARIDRIQVVAWPGGKPPEIRGYVLEWDHFVRTQTTTGTYSRTRKLKNPGSGVMVFWQYYPRARWLKPWKISLIPNDVAGLSASEVERIITHCVNYRILTVELAVDFSPSSGVSRRFLHRHAVFGKSRRRATKKNRLRYGSRKSGKLVRCYKKHEVDAYRVELELHSCLLRRHNISVLDDLVRLPKLVCPKHLQFVDLDWNRLDKHLASKLGDKSDGVIAGAHRRKMSVLRLQRYLRRKGISNTHRFPVPRAINKDVRYALNKWIQNFNRE